MSTTSKALALIALLSLLASSARSDGIGSFDNGHGVFGGIGFKSGSGGGTGNDLLAQTGQPIYSNGTTPILVQ